MQGRTVNTLRKNLSILAVLFGLLVSFTTSVSAACTAPTWDVGTTYSRGDVVSHEQHEWRAKRTTTGREPGTHKPSWADRGACEPDEPPPPPSEPTPMQIYGVWHAGNHYADWSEPREMVDFHWANEWIIGGNNGAPSVNLVVLSFLQPLEVLNMDLRDPTTGVPIGMTQVIVDYFKDAGIRVMMSIGGVTYTDFWDEALASDAYQLGLNAAAIASHFDVGIEIDYERNTDPDLEACRHV